MATPTVEPKLAHSILQLVRSFPLSESRTQALSGLEQLFGVAPGATAAAPRLQDVFAAGKASVADQEPPTTNDGKPAIDSDPAFQRYIARVRGAGVFDGKKEGTPEYEAVYKLVVDKFKARRAAKAETPQQAEERAAALKAEGNDFIRARKFTEAAASYTKAIEASSAGPNSHIFYSNRAAAYLRLGKSTEAEADAHAALNLRPDYVKARNRLGTALMNQERYAEAIAEFEEVLSKAPDNDTAREQLASCRSSLAKSEAATTTTPGASSAGAGGAPGGGLPGLGGLDFGSLMNNPMMQSMLNNPAMMKMASNMMSNPDVMNSVASMMGGGGGGSGGMPDLASMMGSMGMGGGAPAAAAPAPAAATAEPGSAVPPAGAGGMFEKLRGKMNDPSMARYKSDPRLADFWKDAESRNPMALLKHMSNPAVTEMMNDMMSTAPSAAASAAPSSGPIIVEPDTDDEN